jgi:hypothetical protein
MSYSHLGQAKWVPGQISFSTTPTGRLPNVQRLREAGLPIAPYIEHGSYATGQPAIMRFGLDPYRGIMGLGQEEDELSPEGVMQSIRDEGRDMAAPIIQTLQATATPVVLVTAGIVTGVVGGISKRWWLGGILGGVGGFFLSKAIQMLPGASSAGAAA